MKTIKWFVRKNNQIEKMEIVDIIKLTSSNKEVKIIEVKLRKEIHKIVEFK
jgi:hypothetical protein